MSPGIPKNVTMKYVIITVQGGPKNGTIKLVPFLYTFTSSNINRH